VGIIPISGEPLVGKYINNHALTLMALGAGIAHGGVGRGLELASAAAQAERNLQAQRVNFGMCTTRSPAPACRPTRRLLAS
jgi:hypothetical protein